MQVDRPASVGLDLLRTLNEESACAWDKDGRGQLFRKGSIDYVPTGSLLKVHYYAGAWFEEGLPPTRAARPPHTMAWTEGESKGACWQLPFVLRHDKTLPPECSGKSTAARAKATAAKVETEKSKSGGPLVQSFYGLLLAVHRNSVNTTFTLRNVIDGVGVEMTFPLYSPLLLALETKLKGVQKRSKWYWLRDKPAKHSTFAT